MAGPIIATKLHAPTPRRGTVARPRVRDLLQRGAQTRLTLISAPAGFGKTTLLAEWLAVFSARDTLIAWLSLDASDNEPAVFWPHIVASLCAASAGARHAFPDLPDATQPDRSFLSVLVNAMAALETTLHLVVDDYHLIDHPDIQSGLGFLVEHLPPHAHVVISTRADPALPLARLRARGELIEIRAADLRFTGDEAATYLNDIMGLGLTAADCAALEARTEGWIAALQLAVLSLKGRGDPSAFIAGFAGSGRYIVDYLVEEVLERQPYDIRSFLFATCILRRMTGPLCDAVTGLADGASRTMLERLDRQNLFVVPLDEHRQWYRYHHLFADVLMTRLAAEGGRDVALTHRRASEWFEANGERGEAIHHALAAGDVEWTADLVERAIPELSAKRQEAVLRAWMQLLPDAVIRTRPALGVGYAGVLVSNGQFEGIAERLDDAERRLSDLGDPGDVPANIELYRTALAQVRGDNDAAIAHARRAMELSSDRDHLPRAGAAGFLGIVSWSRGELIEAAQWWQACRDGLKAAGRLADVNGATIALADINLTLGRLTEAVRVCETALNPDAADRAPVHRGTADVHASLSILCLERNEIAGAHAHLDTSLQLGELFGLPQNPYRSRVARARLAAAEGDFATALADLDEAERTYISDFFPNVRPIPALKARLHIRMGRIDDAQRWQRDAGVSADDPPSYVREFEHLTLARLLIARASKDAEALSQALDLLARLEHAARDGQRHGSLIEIGIVQAIARRLRGDTTAALAALSGALDRAAPHDHLRPFLDDAEALAELLKLALKRGTAPTFIRKLLGTPPPEPAASRRHPDLIEPLSEREIDVLRLLRSDLSGPEIARELAVSLNTVRTHTKNIYEKLGVSGRRAAVSRADEMRLFARDSR